jgi:5'-deoxynucleotidase
MNNDRLLRLRRLSNVPRWAVIPTIRNQNVAEHSYHVCSLALWLADRSAPVARGSTTREQIMYAALYHDESESMTGDIAAPAKKWMDKLQFVNLSKRLGIQEYENDEVKQIIKMADLLEAYLFLHEEISMGNQAVWTIMNDVSDNLVGAWEQFEYNDHPKPSATELVQELLVCLNASKHPCVEQG